MAFTLTNLNPIGGQSRKGGGPMIWSYVTTDAKATVDTSGYFNEASDILAVGDIIFVYDSNTPTWTIMPVLSNASGVVDVGDGTAISVTDTD